MKVVVITPVGPWHERLVDEATASVRRAWKAWRGPFTELHHEIVPDPEGQLGRSRARNQGMDEHPADFHFLLDADDQMMPDAFRLVDVMAPATFGAVCLNGKVRTWNVWPLDRRTLLERGAHGTLSMGCFVRGDLGLRFNEDMDVAEDFDFYLRLPGFTKRREPLVSIGYDQPSARGPRGYFETNWLEQCNALIDSYRRVSA